LKIKRLSLTIFFTALTLSVGLVLVHSPINVNAQMSTGPKNTTSENFLDENTILGKPFFVEKGKIIGQRVISVSPQPQLEYTFVANATINGVINATNTGTIVNTVDANGKFHTEGQGFIRTPNGEVATWENRVIGTLTKQGAVQSLGAGFWSTPSTRELSFFNDMMSIFKLEVDREGNLHAIEWEWK
jgi:hypothetical protein